MKYFVFVEFLVNAVIFDVLCMPHLAQRYALCQSCNHWVKKELFVSRLSTSFETVLLSVGPAVSNISPHVFFITSTFTH